MSISPHARNEQLQYLSGNDDALAANAARALSTRQDPEAVDILMEKGTDPGVPYRELARRGLSEYPAEMILPGLLRLTKRTYDPGRVPELLALFAQLNHPESVPMLQRFLNEEDLRIRRLAMGVLGNIGDEASIRTLLSTTRDELWMMRETAAAQIQRIGMPALPWLLDALESPELAGEGYPLRLLRQISGVDLGDDPAQWRSWWNERNGTG